jgi:hypothetical protein
MPAEFDNESNPARCVFPFCGSTIAATFNLVFYSTYIFLCRWANKQ